MASKGSISWKEPVYPCKMFFLDSFSAASTLFYNGLSGLSKSNNTEVCDYILLHNTVNSAACIFLSYWCSALKDMIDILGCWDTFTTSCYRNQTRHTEFSLSTQLHIREVHIHFIATSPLTARRALMCGGPVEFHLVLRWKAWLSEVPCLYLCVEQKLDIRADCFCGFDWRMWVPLHNWATPNYRWYLND